MSVMLVAVFCWAAYLYLANSDGIVDPSGHAVGRDFINLWTAGQLVVEGRPALVFDVAGFHELEKSHLGRDFPLHLWSYPPHFLFVTAPLGLLPYYPAFLLWSLLTLAGFAWAVGRPRLITVAILAAAPAALMNLACGQTGALAAALLFGGLRLMHGRPIIAGVLFGLLTVKPQLGLLVPLVLLLERRWSVMASAAATAAGLIALSAAVFGTDLWRAYLTENFAVTRGFLEHGSGLFMAMAPSAFMALRLLGAPLWLAYLVNGLVALLAVIGLVVVWRSSARFDLKVALTGVAALLATPYAHNYDMTVMCAAVLIGYGCIGKDATGKDVTGKEAITWERILLAFVWLLPIVMLPLHHSRIAIAPWLVMAFAVWLWRKSGALAHPQLLGAAPKGD